MYNVENCRVTRWRILISVEIFIEKLLIRHCQHLRLKGYLCRPRRSRCITCLHVSAIISVWPEKNIRFTGWGWVRAVYDEYYDLAVGAMVVRTDSGFSVGAARSRVGEIPLSVTGDKYYKLGYCAPHRSSQFPLLFFLFFSLSLFRPTSRPVAHRHSPRGSSSEYILVRLPVYPGASPPASFLSPPR